MARFASCTRESNILDSYRSLTTAAMRSLSAAEEKIQGLPSIENEPTETPLQQALTEAVQSLPVATCMIENNEKLLLEKLEVLRGLLRQEWSKVSD